MNISRSGGLLSVVLKGVYGARALSYTANIHDRIRSVIMGLREISEQLRAPVVTKIRKGVWPTRVREV